MAKASKIPAIGEIYQLKITLTRSKPIIWRRVEVPSAFNLADLHTIIQITMGWTDSHLHQFKVHGQLYAARILFDEELAYTTPAEKMALKQAFIGEKSAIEYKYDFGDNWEHTIMLEKIHSPEPGVIYPRCTAGKMACPPEDCGGLYGYYHMLAILQDPSHEEYGDMLDWADGAIDPEEFSVEEVDDELKSAFGV